jgi:hypothetical protein
MKFNFYVDFKRYLKLILIYNLAKVGCGQAYEVTK